MRLQTASPVAPQMPQMDLDDWIRCHWSTFRRTPGRPTCARRRVETIWNRGGAGTQPRKWTPAERTGGRLVSRITTDSCGCPIQQVTSIHRWWMGVLRYVRRGNDATVRDDYEEPSSNRLRRSGEPDRVPLRVPPAERQSCAASAGQMSRTRPGRPCRKVILTGMPKRDAAGRQADAQSRPLPKRYRRPAGAGSKRARGQTCKARLRAKGDGCQYVVDLTEPSLPGRRKKEKQRCRRLWKPAAAACETTRSSAKTVQPTVKGNQPSRSDNCEEPADQRETRQRPAGDGSGSERERPQN